MVMLLNKVLPLLAVAVGCLACDDCAGPRDSDLVFTRHVRRMQPDAQGAAYGPRGPLEWGQLNFLHTTDTHGWLEGHLKEQNYGADWGDFASFTKRMKQKARDYDVDLLIVDTGDLHDGAGLSDATSPNGRLSNPIFENIDYDVLAIGNHELYESDIAYETFNQFSKSYGDRYLTSNVEILNPSTGKFEYIGHKFRHFTTEKGVRIMAFGVLYDFTGNSNASRVIKAADMVQQKWFTKAVMTEDIDLFLLIGHNPVRPEGSGSTFPTIHNAIRQMRPRKPVQIFGGHTHIRDFAVYDNTTTALESGRYCETLGWLSMNGLRRGAIKNKIPARVPQARRPALNSTDSTTKLEQEHTAKGSISHPLYSRRYIDWNRLSFEYHAKDSQRDTFDTSKGAAISKEIFEDRKELHLRKLYGCAPRTWCQSCKPFGAPGNIFTLLSEALATTVINDTRADNARIIIINTGSVRFDLVKGPFTYDDSFIVSPFTDTFQYLPNVPYDNAKQVLKILNNGAFEKRRETGEERERELGTRDFGFTPLTDLSDSCVNPQVTRSTVRRTAGKASGRIIRRQDTKLTPGYTTSDDFGDDGDDTRHSPIPFYDQPNDLQANASFPTDGSMPAVVDVIFLDFIAGDVLAALKQTGQSYSESDIGQYLPTNFTTNSYLPAYAKVASAWQKNVPNCPVGRGVGS